MSVVLIEKFETGVSGSRPSWIQHHERYQMASGSIKKKQAYQENILIYAMGKAAPYSTLQQMLKQKYNRVKVTFDVYFVAENIIFERIKFKSRF